MEVYDIKLVYLKGRLPLLRNFYMLTHVTFLHLSKIEMMYETLIINVEVQRGSTLTFIHDLPYIASILFTMHCKKIMQPSKSTFRTNLLHEHLQE